MSGEAYRVTLLAGGLVALFLAVTWKVAAHRSDMRGLAKGLDALEPAQRAEAAEALVSRGLERAAPVLLAHLAREGDASARELVALAVAWRQWEPSGSSAVAELRSWASGELARYGYEVTELGPAVTRLSDMGGPRLAPPPLPPIHWRNPSGALPPTESEYVTTAEPGPIVRLAQ